LMCWSIFKPRPPAAVRVAMCGGARSSTHGVSSRRPVQGGRQILLVDLTARAAEAGPAAGSATTAARFSATSAECQRSRPPSPRAALAQQARADERAGQPRRRQQTNTVGFEEGIGIGAGRWRSWRLPSPPRRSTPRPHWRSARARSSACPGPSARLLSCSTGPTRTTRTCAAIPAGRPATPSTSSRPPAW
jgi:hypothetical protein